MRLLRRARLLLPPLALAVAVAAANLGALQTPLRLDLTSGDVFTITPQTEAILQRLEQPVRITFFYDLRSRAHTDAKTLLEQYAQKSDRITVAFYDPQLQPAEARRRDVAFAGTAIFETAGRQIRTSGLSEIDFTNGLLRVTQNAARRLCFTDGHLESDPFSFKSHDHMEGAEGQSHSHGAGGRPLELHERHGMGMARDALAALGYDVAKVLLLMGPGQLEGCSVLIAASPQRPFLPQETDQILAFIERGGRLLLMLEPNVDAGLATVLASFGIAADGRAVIDPESHYWTDATTPAVSSYPRHKLTRNLPLTFFPGALSFSPLPTGVPPGVRITPMIETSARSRLESINDTDESRGGARPRTIMLEAAKKDEDRLNPRLVAIGDGDFATNSFFAILGNGGLFLNAVSYLADQENLIDIQPRNYELPRMRLTNRQMEVTFLVSTILLPAAVIALGTVVWWRRR